MQQFEEAAKTAQIGVIDMEELSEFAEPGDIEQLDTLQQQIEDYMRELAERQGLERDDRGGYQLTPKAYRLFQGKLLERIFSNLASLAHRPASGADRRRRGGRDCSRPSPTSSATRSRKMDIPASLTNAMLRGGPGLPVRLRPDDIEIHRTRNTPKCATVVLMDMSGSMRYGGQYVNVKRMGLALDGLIRREYPGDFLQFIEMYTFAKPRHGRRDRVADAQAGDDLSIPWVRLKADMSRETSARCRSRRTSPTSSTRCNWPASSWPCRTRRTGKSS